MLKTIATVGTATALTAVAAYKIHKKNQHASTVSFSDLQLALPQNHWMMDENIPRDDLLFMTDRCKREWYFQIRPDSGVCTQKTAHFPIYIQELMQDEESISLDVFHYLPKECDLNLESVTVSSSDLDGVCVPKARRLMKSAFAIWHKANCISDLRVAQRCFFRYAQVVHQMNPDVTDSKNFLLSRIERRLLVMAYSCLNRIHPYFRSDKDQKEMENLFALIKNLEQKLSGHLSILKLEKNLEVEFGVEANDPFCVMLPDLLPTLTHPSGPSFIR